MSEQPLPPQHQGRQPGRESEMTPRPKSENRVHHRAGKLKGKTASSRAATAGSVAQSPLHLRAKGLSLLFHISRSTKMRRRPNAWSNKKVDVVLSFPGHRQP